MLFRSINFGGTNFRICKNFGQKCCRVLNLAHSGENPISFGSLKRELCVDAASGMPRTMVTVGIAVLGGAATLWSPPFCSPSPQTLPSVFPSSPRTSPAPRIPGGTLHGGRRMRQALRNAPSRTAPPGPRTSATPPPPCLSTTLPYAACAPVTPVSRCTTQCSHHAALDTSLHH